ncbi:response regulator aspartate phosphatase [Bacillus sp. FSL M8-0168]|uniref:response regulator aspartate phosphatase n=1 Tax=Bacillus sp. FSL M8-0168 TaxID=2921614 RepID=UPI0030FD34CE
MEKIAYEKMGQAINDWYKVIKQHNISKATEMRDEIQKTLPNMEKNQDVLLYFNLIDSRFKLLTENFNESGNLLKYIEKQALEEDTDNMIQYYFYFFSGMYEFYKKNFTKAINFYRIAESKLIKIDDEIEKAEFHYRLAVAYYEIRQNFFSLNHAEKALESFNAHDTYEEKTINCQMVIAANYVDLYRFEDAEKQYNLAIETASSFGYKFSESLGCFNLGICHERRDMLSEAALYFRKAIEIPEHRESVISIRSMYMLSRVLYKMNLPEEARMWYRKSLLRANEENDHVYQAKLKIIYCLYDRHDLQDLEKAMEQLQDKNLWSDVADLAINVAYYYKKQGDTDVSSKYFEKACHAKDQILKLTEALS